ncbi:MAG: thioesterase family protein [Verrucomicrobiales bacterium]|nr:thioesterase family protein [Verrucomicrobiales bacterium]
MSHRFTYRRRVEFADTDVAGIMHFSNFFKFMEVTEHAFYRSMGFSVHPFRKDTEGGGPKVGWPRVHASADYRLPLNFEEEVEIELLVEEVRNKTVGLYFNFWKSPDDESQKAIAATGRFTVVCVKFDEELRRMKAVAIPDEWREKLSAAPDGLIPAKTS